MNTPLINKDSNDMLSKLRGNDLLEYLNILSEYYLEYRNKIDLPNSLSFGIEIEFENVYEGIVRDFLIDSSLYNSHDNYDCGWIAKHDGSLSSGGEVNSPASTDNKKFWEALKKVCLFLKSKNAVMNEEASCHMHYAATYLGNDVEAWRVFLKTYAAYEAVLFRFFYGDMLCARYRLLTFSFPIGSTIYNKLDVLNRITNPKGLLDVVNRSAKYQSINFANVDFDNINKDHYKNTLELRIPNATTNHIILQNNINALGKLMLSSKLKLIDEEFIDYKLKKDFVEFDSNRHRYSEVLLKDALEFCDVNFDNNLDKAYFLKQYLKDFDNSCDSYHQVAPKVFTR